MVHGDQMILPPSGEGTTRGNDRNGTGRLQKLYFCAWVLLHSMVRSGWIGLNGSTELCDLCGGVDYACDACWARFTWLDGTAVTDNSGHLLYHNWWDHQPTNESVCVWMSESSGKWKSLPCTNSYSFVCKKGRRKIFMPKLYNCIAQA